MDVTIKDKDMKAVAILDTYESLIWTDRYSLCGDFEIYTQVTKRALEILLPGNYLFILGSDRTMIIEGWDIKTTPDLGGMLTVTGRSLESLLDRRIILEQTVLAGSFQLAIKKLLDENAIVCTGYPNRCIPNLIFEMSSDTNITSLELDGQYYGDNLYETIRILCESNNVGFKITVNSSNQLVFKLYYGVDRSYFQSTNPYVVFSPNFENLLSSHYVQNMKTLKTFSLVGGEGEGSDRKMTSVADETMIGLSRREMFTNAADLSSTIDGGSMTPEEYLSQLAQRGVDDLGRNSFTSAFDGEIDPTVLFIYGTDYFLGDIVQIRNEYGLESRSRVSELILSQDKTGNNVYPTFMSV